MKLCCEKMYSIQDFSSFPNEENKKGKEKKKNFSILNVLLKETSISLLFVYFSGLQTAVGLQELG